MTEKTSIKKISFRQATAYFDNYPEFLASTKRSMRQGLIDLGLEPEDEYEEDRLPATKGTAFTPALPAMTVLTLRAKP